LVGRRFAREVDGHRFGYAEGAMTLDLAPARALLLAVSLAATGCHRPDADRGEPAPAASVVGIGVALGACDDAAACEGDCEAGAPEACRRLAANYAFGNGGVARDERRATELYLRACAADDAPSCVFAGHMYEYARGVAGDDAAAARLYARSCDLGWAAGCFNLAILVEGGRGVAPDRARAAALYDRACVAGAKASCDRAASLRRAASTDAG